MKDNMLEKELSSLNKRSKNILNEVLTFWDIVISCVLFLLCMFVFSKMYSLQEDQALHLSFIFNKMKLHLLFFNIDYNSLTQWLVYFFGFGNKTLMYQAFLFLLSISFVLKYFVIRWINTDFLSLYGISYTNKWILRICAIFISFSFPVFTYFQITSANWYRGLVPHCVWHNPTIIIAMPFVLMFFWESYKILVLRDRRHFLLLFILLFLNFFTKPVFLMPALPIFVLFFIMFDCDSVCNYRLSLSKRKILSILILTIPCLLIILYLYNRTFGVNGLDISFVNTLSNHNKNYNYMPSVYFVMRRFFGIGNTNNCLVVLFVILSLISRFFWLNASYFFSLFALKKRISFLNFYALSIWLLALIFSLLITEIKNPASENLLWPLISCNNVLLVVGVNNFLFLSNQSKINVFALLSFSLLLLHAYCGFLYLIRLIMNGVWY